MVALLSLASHKSSCNCTGCGMRRAGVCINCADKVATLILESGSEELTVKPCSGACRETIELYFSTPPERWRAQLDAPSLGAGSRRRPVLDVTRAAPIRPGPQT